MNNKQCNAGDPPETLKWRALRNFTSARSVLPTISRRIQMWPFVYFLVTWPISTTHLRAKHLTTSLWQVRYRYLTSAYRKRSRYRNGVFVRRSLGARYACLTISLRRLLTKVSRYWPLVRSAQSLKHQALWQRIPPTTASYYDCLLCQK